MTDGLRKSHLRKAHQVGLSKVGLPEGNHNNYPFNEYDEGAQPILSFHCHRLQP